MDFNKYYLGDEGEKFDSNKTGLYFFELSKKTRVFIQVENVEYRDGQTQKVMDISVITPVGRQSVFIDGKKQPELYDGIDFNAMFDSLLALDYVHQTTSIFKRNQDYKGKIALLQDNIKRNLEGKAAVRSGTEVIGEQAMEKALATSQKYADKKIYEHRAYSDSIEFDC